MKTIKTLFLLLVIATAGTAQEEMISRHFSDYEKDASIEKMEVTRKSFELMSEIEVDDPDGVRVVNALQQLNGVKAIFKEHTDEAQTLSREAVERVEADESYEELMSVRTADETVLMTVREENDEIKELSIVVGADRCFMVATLYGTIDIKELSRVLTVIRNNRKNWFQNFENVSKEDLVISSSAEKRTTATPKWDKDLGIRLFPNPATEFIKLESKNGVDEAFGLAFYSLIGEQLGEAKTINLPYEIRIADLPTGTYIVRLTTADGAFKNYRVVKK